MKRSETTRETNTGNNSLEPHQRRESELRSLAKCGYDIDVDRICESFHMDIFELLDFAEDILGIEFAYEDPELWFLQALHTRKNLELMGEME